MHVRSNQGRILRRLLLVTASFAIGTVVWILLGESENLIAAEGAAAKPMARIGDRTISRAEVLDLAAGELVKLHLFGGDAGVQVERLRHNLIAGTARTRVHMQLLDQEAAKRGISREELLDQEVKDKAEPVTDEHIGAYFNQNRGRIRGSLEQARAQIRQILERQHLTEAYESYIASLEEAYGVEYLFEPFRVEIAGTGPQLGPEDAPVTLVEFSDFECPYCNRVLPTLDQIKKTYGDKVRVVFRQFPLPIHPNAPKAAEAALCAHEQGKFWQMHDLMFGDNRNLDLAGLKNKARSIEGLDGNRFDLCLDSGKHAPTVAADQQEGARLGVSSTPSFFINGRLLTGARSFDVFSEIIEDELERRGAS